MSKLELIRTKNEEPDIMVADIEAKVVHRIPK